MFHPTVIFAITKGDGDWLVPEFHRYNKHKGNRPIECLGSYSGVEETSYLMAAQDFDATLRDSFFLEGQESVLRISGCNKQYATLHYSDGRTEGLGSMCCVPEEVARSYPSWTKRLDNNNFYIAAKINPDHAAEIGVNHV